MTQIERKQQAITRLEDVLKTPINDILESFLTKFNSRHTIRSYKSILSSFFNQNDIQVLGDLEYLPQQQVEIVNNFLSPYVEKERVYNQKLACIKSFFSYLSIFGYKNFLNKYTTTFKKSPKKSNTQGLSETQVKTLLHTLKENANNSRQQHKKYLMVLSLITMGLRVSEIKQLDIEKMVSNDEYIYQEINSKTGKARVNIPLKLYREMKAFYEKYGLSQIFVSNQGSVMSNSGILDIISRIGKKILNVDICNHSFRKSFITIMNNKGINPTHIMNATLHSNTQIIHYYTDTDLTKSASNVMAEII